MGRPEGGWSASCLQAFSKLALPYQSSNGGSHPSSFQLINANTFYYSLESLLRYLTTPHRSSFRAFFYLSAKAKRESRRIEYRVWTGMLFEVIIAKMPIKGRRQEGCPCNGAEVLRLAFCAIVSVTFDHAQRSLIQGCGCWWCRSWWWSPCCGWCCGSGGARSNLPVLPHWQSSTIVALKQQRSFVLIPNASWRKLERRWVVCAKAYLDILILQL